MLKKHGFTLIELLVVIAVIALLLGILLPSLERVRECARIVVCSSQLRQIGFSFHMYIDDNEDRVPHVRHWIEGMGWYNDGDFDKVRNGQLYPYLNTLDIHVCPTFRTYSEVRDPTFSYAMSYQLGGGGPYPTIRTASEVMHPGEYGIIVEENPIPLTQEGYVYGSLKDGAFYPWAFCDALGTYHGSGRPMKGNGHLLMFDSHVELRSGSTVDWDRMGSDP